MEEKSRVGDIVVGDSIWGVGPTYEPELYKCFDIEEGPDYRRIYIENPDDNRDRRLIVADLHEGLDLVSIPTGSTPFYIKRKDCKEKCIEILGGWIESCNKEIDRYRETIKKLEGE